MTSRRIRPWHVAVAFAVMLTGLVVTSPFLASWVASLPLNWRGLSDVGQSYGAISAVLSGVALCGIAASLLMQRQQYRLSEHQALRQRHHELIKMTFDDPSLKPCWGEDASGSGLSEKEAAYCNLIVDHWHMLWRLGQVSEEAVRGIARRFFDGEIGRLYWRAYGSDWMPADDRGTAMFMMIFSQELARAVAAGSAQIGRAHV